MECEKKLIREPNKICAHHLRLQNWVRWTNEKKRWKQNIPLELEFLFLILSIPIKFIEVNQIKIYTQ